MAEQSSAVSLLQRVEVMISRPLPSAITGPFDRLPPFRFSLDSQYLGWTALIHPADLSTPEERSKEAEL